MKSQYVQLIIKIFRYCSVWKYFAFLTKWKCYEHYVMQVQCGIHTLFSKRVFCGQKKGGYYIIPRVKLHVLTTNPPPQKKSQTFWLADILLLRREEVDASLGSSLAFNKYFVVSITNLYKFHCIWNNTTELS